MCFYRTQVDQADAELMSVKHMQSRGCIDHNEPLNNDKAPAHRVAGL
jgi:hypothetical protein